MKKIPKKLIERLMRNSGAKRISNDAKETLSKYILEKIENMTFLAIKNSKHFGRKLITKDDIEFAIKNIKQY